MPNTSYPRKSFQRKRATPEQQLASAIDRAQRDHIAVAGSGTFADGRKFWIVASQSVEGMHHIVSQHGKSLECDCIYSQMQHKVCIHRAATYLHLRDQAIKAVNEAREAAQSAPAQPERASLTPAQRRESAILATDDTPFSIYKNS